MFNDRKYKNNYRRFLIIISFIHSFIFKYNSRFFFYIKIKRQSKKFYIERIF